MTDLVKMANESINISEKSVKSFEQYFELIDPVWLPRNFVNSSNLTLEFDPKNKKTIIGFFIKTDGTDDQLINAIKIASRLTNYLSLKTGQFVFHKHPREVINGKIQIPVNGGFSATLTALIDLDFTDESLCNLINNDSIENQLMAHFASGQRALNAKIYDQAIREFFIIIEGSGIDDEERYLSLRNAVSHKIIFAGTIAQLNRNFGLSMSVGDHFDITDPNIHGLLKEESNKLRDIAIKYVESKI